MSDKRNLLPTPTTLDNVEKRTTHAGGNLTLQGALCGVNPVDAERHLMPSPRASDGQGGPDPSDRRYDRDDVEGRLRRDGVIPLLPTPQAFDSVDAVRTPEQLAQVRARTGRSPRGNGNLRETAVNELGHRDLLPTPVAQDGNGHMQDMAADVGNNGRSVSLGDVLARLPQDGNTLLSTPTTSDSRGARQGGAHDENVRVPRLAAAVEVDLPAELAAQAEGNALLPTPNAGLGEHRRANGQHPDKRRAGGHAVSLADVACGMVQDGLFSEPDVPPAAGLMPTPTSSDGSGGGVRANLSWENTTRSTGDGGASRLRDVVGLLGDSDALLPTPAVNDMGEGKTPEQWDAWTAGMKERHGNGNGHGNSLSIEAQRLLPTPMAHDFIPSTEAEMNRHSPRLNAIGGLLPTPRATDGSDGPVTNCPSVQAICDGSAGRTPRLSEMAAGGLLPTPAARDGLPAKTEETMRRQRDRGYGPNLNDVAANYLPTPKARDWTGHGPADMRRNTPDLSAISRILPTPRASDAKGTDSPGEHARHSPGLGAVGHLLSEDDVEQAAPTDPEKLMPTPSASDGIGPNNPQNRIDNGHHVQLVDLGMSKTVWGKYEAAIRCWERATRPAPAPTEVNKNGNPRLAAQFSEWLMGWPEGHVTDPAIGISRNDQLRITGNGVVPQQAAHALRLLLRVAYENR